MKKINLNTLQFEYDPSDPPGYAAGGANVGGKIDSALLGGTVFELPEGQSICPYHYHYAREEWLLVLSGSPTVRHAAGEDTLEPGDVVGFPVGGDGGHKVTNNGPEVVRVLLLSTKGVPDVCGYPDSGKVGVWFAGEDSMMVRKESAVDYYDGET
jgi:uncharacterized cupin superfamily protein